MIQIYFQFIRWNKLDQDKNQRKYLQSKQKYIRINQKQDHISVSQRSHLKDLRVVSISYLILRKFYIIWSSMITSNKKIQSIKNSEFNRLTNKIQITAYQSLKPKSTATKFTHTKKYSFNKNDNNFITLQNSKQMTNQSQFTQSKFFNNSIQVQKQNKKHYKQKDPKRQTFRDFIRKIQSHNQNHLTKQNQHIVLQEQHFNHKQKQKDQLKINKTFEVILKGSFQTDKKQKQVTPLKSEKSQNEKTKQKLKNFIIHDKMNKSFYSREYRRSITQQQINIKNIDFTQDKILQETHLTKKCSIDNFTINKMASKMNSMKPSKNQLKFVNIRLSQNLKDDSQESTAKQFLQSNFQLQSSLRHLETNKSDHKNLQNHNRNSQVKHSKIRIRLGSSLYSRNIWTLQSFNSISKNSLKKQVQNLLTDSGKIHIQRKIKTSLNSQFCQNKITQAQNMFIQKRRLLPTAEIKSRQNVLKTKKQFFTVPNSFDKYRKQKVQIEREPPQGQNLNGWQSNYQGVTHFKIEQLL